MSVTQRVEEQRTNEAERITATCIGPGLGAEIEGVNLSRPISDDAFRKILDYFHKYQVIFFRRQQIDAAALVSFSSRFGSLDVHHMTEHVIPDLPQIRILSNAKKGGRAVGITRGGMHWHSDLSYKPVPALATLLYGLECPPEGADTQFVSMYTALEMLKPKQRALIDGKAGVHDRNFRYSELYPNRPALTAEQVAQVPPVEHPIIRVHPATERKCLYLSKDVVSKILSIDEREGRELLDQLETDATRVERIYSHKWQVGDVLVWDNRCTLHRATPYDNRYARTLYRTQVRGEVPIPG
jgi:taurine dioxygenase